MTVTGGIPDIPSPPPGGRAVPGKADATTEDSALRLRRSSPPIRRKMTPDTIRKMKFRSNPNQPNRKDKGNAGNVD